MAVSKQRKEKKVPSMDDAMLIVDTSVYTIRDLYLKDKKGLTRATISSTTLRPMQQTMGHSHSNPEDRDEVYSFLQGQGWMIVSDTAVPVQAGDYVLVEKGTYHKVINIGAASDLVFITYYPGQPARPTFTE